MTLLPADIQLRLARLNTDLLLLQRAVHELMHQCTQQSASESEDDLIAAAQYRALEAALRVPGQPLPAPDEERAELLPWPAFTTPMPRAMRA
ncbi:MAG TPA: hypothetical protein VF555_09510 [Variovorax sp.]